MAIMVTQGVHIAQPSTCPRLAQGHCGHSGSSHSTACRELGKHRAIVVTQGHSTACSKRAQVRVRWGDPETITTKVQKRRLEWLGHLARMPEHRMP